MPPLSLLQLPVEIQREVVLAGLVRTDLLSSHDSLRAMIRNQEYLKRLVLVSRLWHGLVTPLLYGTIVIEGLMRDQEVDSLHALHGTLKASPDLRRLVRHFHLPDPGEVFSGFAADVTQLLPNLQSVTKMMDSSDEGSEYLHPECQLRALSIVWHSGSVLDDRRDFSRLARLEVCYKADLDEYWQLQPTLLPNLTDLRLSDLWFRELPRCEPLLRAVGPQLRTLHIFELNDDGGSDDDDDDDDDDHARQPFNLDIPALCPSLVDLGLNVWKTVLPEPSTSSAHGASAAWGGMRLNTWLLDDPSDHNSSPRAHDGRLLRLRSDSQSWVWFKAIDRIRPKTVILPNPASAWWSDRDWADARRLARVLRQDGRSIALEDRRGTVVEPAPETSSLAQSPLVEVEGTNAEDAVVGPASSPSSA